MKQPFILTLDELEKVTNGYWVNKKDDLKIFGLAISNNQIDRNYMMVATLPQYWGSHVANSHNNFAHKVAKGIGSFMLEKAFVDSTDSLPSVPLLVVKNTNDALKKIAISCRNRSSAKRIQVTGTEGKTGFKYALNYLIGKQAKSHAQESSANLTIPILLSLTALKEDTEYTVVEVSCPQPNRCSERSKIISPDVAVITNLNVSHMNTHGSTEKLIQHKAESLDGLKETGFCVINEDTALYDDFIKTVATRKKVDYIGYSERNEKAYGLLIERVFENLGWTVKARICGQELNYRVNKIQEHWPLTTIGLLSCIAKLGLDVDRAAKDMQGFDASWDSMGEINKHHIGNDESFLFYDQHFSITETALISALNDVNRIKVKGKKIAVISGEHNSDEFSEETHKRIADQVDKTDIDILYTVGEYAEFIVNKLKKPAIFKGHFFKVEQLKNILIDTISEDDLVFIKGMTKLNFRYLSNEINKVFRKT